MFDDPQPGGPGDRAGPGDRGSGTLAGVDLNLLLALDALLIQQNVTRAAVQMSVGQPAMSSALARLRRQLGDPLLVREGRTYVLTAFAESLVGPVREAILAADAVLGIHHAFDPSTSERTFSIVTSDYVAVVLLRPLLGALIDEAPRVRVSIQTVGMSSEEGLRSGSADLVIRSTELAQDYQEFPHQTLFEDRYVLVADGDNTEVHDSVTVEEFSRFAYLAARGAQQSTVETQLDFAGISRNVRIQVPSLTSIPLMLPGTKLVALVHERLARQLAASAGLRIVPSPVELRPTAEAMYWNRRNERDPGHQWLRRRLRAQAEQL